MHEILLYITSIKNVDFYYVFIQFQTLEKYPQIKDSIILLDADEFHDIHCNKIHFLAFDTKHRL